MIHPCPHAELHHVMETCPCGYRAVCCGLCPGKCAITAWDESFTEPADALDVLPAADLTEHTASDDCLCGPRSEPVQRMDGSMGWVRIHHSLDGREHAEEAS